MGHSILGISLLTSAATRSRVSWFHAKCEMSFGAPASGTACPKIGAAPRRAGGRRSGSGFEPFICSSGRHPFPR